MSKNSPKQNLEQLIDWLAWRKSSGSSKTAKKRFSKAEVYKDVYKQTRRNYGRKSN